MREHLKVLIVEDQVITAFLFKKKLQRFGYEICGPVPTGEKAIEVSEQEKPDFILMDINLLGEMDGIEAAKIILENHDPKIIFVTGYADEDTQQKAMDLNPMAYLLKPFDFNQVDSLIRSAFEG